MRSVAAVRVTIGRVTRRAISQPATMASTVTATPRRANRTRSDPSTSPTSSMSRASCTAPPPASPIVTMRWPSPVE